MFDSLRSYWHRPSTVQDGRRQILRSQASPQSSWQPLNPYQIDSLARINLQSKDNRPSHRTSFDSWIWPHALEHQQDPWQPARLVLALPGLSPSSSPSVFTPQQGSRMWCRSPIPIVLRKIVFFQLWTIWSRVCGAELWNMSWCLACHPRLVFSIPRSRTF